MSWGEFPADVRAMLKAREWDNPVNLRRRLLGERPFPIAVALRPPSGQLALRDLGRFRDWIQAWRDWPRPLQLQYAERSYRQIGRHLVPVTLTLGSMQALIEALGTDCIGRARRWEQAMAPVLALDAGLFPVLVRHLAAVESLAETDAVLLARLLPQLQAGMGTGRYLRALPVRGVDTKFVESNETLIAELLDVLHGGAVSASGGLRAWLGCRDNPTGWVYLRALSREGRRRLGGLRVLSVPTQQLLETPLPAGRLLVVENLQSGLALPALDDTIAVFGGGQNLAWTRADWLRDRQIGYWGDIDTWGLKFLSDARLQHEGVQALLMDVVTWERYRDRAVREPQPYLGALPGLHADELDLDRRLRTTDGGALRLEQERLDVDHVQSRLRAWLDGTQKVLPGRVTTEPVP